MGILAAREMAMAGMGPIHTTSRSGRLADTRPEIMMIMDQLQQIAEHTRWRIDGSDSSAMLDLMASISKTEPPNPLLQFDPAMHFNKAAGALLDKMRSGYEMGPEEIEWMERIKDDFEEMIKSVKAKNRAEYTKETHALLVQMEDKYEQINKLLQAVKK